MPEIKSCKGFTLIEMLLVITIIGMLAVIAITSFGSMTKSAKLDIAGDLLVSLIKQQQGLAKSGKTEIVDGKQGTFCYGVRFEKSSKGGSVSTFKTPYVRLDKNTGVAESCGKPDQFIPFTAASDFKIEAISYKAVDKENIELSFKPPLGKPFFTSSSDAAPQQSLILDANDFKAQVLTNINTATSIKKPNLIKLNNDLFSKIKCKAGDYLIIQITNDQDSHFIVFDPVSGLARKTKTEESLCQ
jgi:prepilin-type N-terminal cleavage/methylation domain-containing protein